MKQRTVSEASPSALESLIDDAVLELERLGYALTTVKTHRDTWRSFLRFVTDECSPPCFSQTLADSFLQSKGISLGETNDPLCSRQRRVRVAIDRLGEFAQHRYISCRRRRSRKSILPTRFEDLLAEYIKWCKKHQGLRSTSQRVRRGHVEKFLHFLDSRPTKIDQVQPPVLSEFIASLIHLKPSTVSGIASSLRCFLRYLFMKEYLPSDLSDHVPVIPGLRYDYLPMTWSPEETEALLKAVDRASPVGKRDYAILLLAARLGLRAGDIRGLQLEHLNWQEAQIAIRQSKTGDALTLPLSDEVGRALIDYLQYARPQSACRHVFLCAHAPFGPFADSNCFHGVITKYRRLAGIKVRRERHHGLHSLRHALATRLLRAQTPLPTISAILGHRAPDSTRVYARVDLASLRTAALDIEEVLNA
jgi:integrase